MRGGGALRINVIHQFNLGGSWGVNTPEEGVFTKTLDANLVPRKLSSWSSLTSLAVLLSWSQVAISAEVEVLASDEGIWQ